MDDGDNSAEGNQQPNDGQSVIAHEVQHEICRNGNGNGQISVVLDGGHEQKCPDERGDQEQIKTLVLQQLHLQSPFMYRRMNN